MTRLEEIQRKIKSGDLRRLLLVRLDAIGDVVLTTPFLRELRRNLPNAWITLVVKPGILNLVERCPYVNEALVFDGSVPEGLKTLRMHWRAVRLASRYFWWRRFDLAILPRWDIDYYHGTYLMYFSRARLRVGYAATVNAQKRQLTGDLDRLLTHRLNDSELKHEVEHNLDVLRYLGGQVYDDSLELWLDEHDESFAAKLLGKYETKPGRLLVAFGPGAGAPKRQWPLNFYIRLGQWLQREFDAWLLIIGGPGEEPLGRELENGLGPSTINTVGQTTLRQAAALLKRCALFIGSDAGPLHMATAVRTPVIEISCHSSSGSPFSPNSPARFGPWGDNHVVLRPAAALPLCFDECVSSQPHCIVGISVAQVQQVLPRLIDRAHSTAHQAATMA